MANVIQQLNKPTFAELEVKFIYWSARVILDGISLFCVQSSCCRVFDEKLVLIMFCVENGCFEEYNV